MNMFFLAFTKNDFDAEIGAYSSQGSVIDPYYEHETIQTFVLLHERESMVRPDVIAALVGKWKRSFHPSERPITPDMEDAASAFLYWLEEQPLGYVIPKTQHSLTSLPIFDVVEV